MITKLTAERALEELRAVVREAGEDYVYERVDGSCKYFNDDGQPSCGVGRVFARLGVTADVFDSGCNILQIRTLMNVNPFPFDVEEDAVIILQKFQAYQDKKQPWGLALQHAEKVLQQRRGGDVGYAS